MKIKAKKLIHRHTVDGLVNEGLTADKEYLVIGIEGDSYRVLDDNEEPTLHDKKLFEIVDPSLPSEWIKTTFDEENYIEPPETSAPGFYEDYFDGVPYAIDIFKELLVKLGIQS